MGALIQPRNLMTVAVRDDLHRDVASAHAVMRAGERCPRPLTYREVMEHERGIRAGATACIGGHAQRQFHRIEEGGLRFYAVWCCRLGCIVTYLRGPHEWRGTLCNHQAAS